MSQPGTFERVYAALKEKLRSGAVKPGERLEPAALSEELFASVTPIRDALHRLTGERLVDAPRQEGFRVPQLSETRLRNLYAWRCDLLLLALARRHLTPGTEWKEGKPDLLSLAERRRAIFVALARATGNLEHMIALEAVSERLEPLERFEESLLGDIEAEINSIGEAISSGDAKLLKKRLLSYHRRREKIVPDLIALLELA